MTFQFETPVKLPRWTTEEFRQKKAEYVAKYGYTIQIPGASDIFHWESLPEPNQQELALYKAKKVKELGEVRYDQIKRLMTQKREKFLRMLASPTPDFIRNASSALTFLDDINDTLGTLGVVARTVAHFLPAALGKFVMGPAGWLFTAADIVNIGMTLSRLPYKSRRLQHELHSTLKDHPLSKRAKLKRLNKLKRLKLSKGEIIEALQTTDNVFGYGICLGPIMSLLYDIPSGLYHHVRGKKVEIVGMPAPLLWFDRIWSNALKSSAEFFYGIPPVVDDDLDKATVAYYQAVQMMKSCQADIAALDLIPDIEGIQHPPRVPEHPSTLEVIRNEGLDPNEAIGWPSTNATYKDATANWEQNRDQVNENVTGWMERGRSDNKRMICAQNAVQAGQQSLANLCGDNEVEWDYEPVTSTLLKLMNQGYRFPEDMTQEQAQDWAQKIQELELETGEVDVREAIRLAEDDYQFKFTIEVPERPEDVPGIPWESHRHEIERLRHWYVKNLMYITSYFSWQKVDRHPQRQVALRADIAKLQHWLDLYSWPEGHPTTIEQIWLNYAYHRLGLPSTRFRYAPVFLTNYRVPPDREEFAAAIIHAWTPYPPVWAFPGDMPPAGTDAIIIWAGAMYT